MSNGCGQASTFYNEFTASFAPSVFLILAITNTVPESFNFANLPCPQASLSAVPKQLYQPRLAVPEEFINSLRAQNPAGREGCTQCYQADA